MQRKACQRTPPAPARGTELERWAVVALGSNLGDRSAALEFARRQLAAAGFAWVLASPVRATAPLGGPGPQRWYLNQVLAASAAPWSPAPERLLGVAHSIEYAAGRRRSGEPRWGPRPLDIDILLIGGQIVSKAGLEIPHPRLPERDFLLEPLALWWPEVRHPVLGTTFAALHRRACGRSEAPRRIPPS